MAGDNAIMETYDRVFGGERNMGMLERAASTGFGLVLAAAGLQRGADLPGTLMGIAGAALVARGMSGHCPVKAMLDSDGNDRISDTRQSRGAAVREGAFI